MMTEELQDIEQDVEALDDGPDREGRTGLRCYCCGSRYRRGRWRCCTAPAGTSAQDWSDQWHRFEEEDGRKVSHCPRHPCPECLAGGATAERVPAEPAPPPPTVTPFDPEADEPDWKEKAAGDDEKLREEIPF